MSEEIAGPPALVTQRDGGVEPFDADRICQSLFAATEALGVPNAFLARELTDAVVHFVTGDPTESPMTTDQLADRIVQVVRELGQPALARAYARRTVAASPESVRPVPLTLALDPAEAPAALARRCLRAYSERAVFSRDLVAAQADGLVLLAGLDTPRALACTVLDVTADWDALPARCEAAGQALVLDAPEWHTHLAPADRDWLLRLPALVGRHLIVNLNSALPPEWARQRGNGPLFADAHVPAEPAVEAWLDSIRALPRVRWDWHVQARDFAAGPARDRLGEVARRALGGANVAFVVDRPRRPIALGEGMDRQRPAVLLEVGLDLAAFLRLPAIDGNAERFNEKLPSLARMAVSAGAQKRKYLRRHTDFGGFLLDRARLAVVPLGLETITPGKLDVVQALHEHLQSAGRAASLDVALASLGPGLADLLPSDARRSAAADADPEQHLRTAGALHAITGHGTVHVILPGDSEPGAVVELLHFAWRRTEVVRVAFSRLRVGGGPLPAANPQAGVQGSVS